MKHYLRKKNEFVLGQGYAPQAPTVVCEVEYERQVDKGVPQNVWFEEINTAHFEAIKSYLLPIACKELTTT